MTEIRCIHVHQEEPSLPFTVETEVIPVHTSDHLKVITGLTDHLLRLQVGVLQQDPVPQGVLVALPVVQDLLPGAQAQVQDLEEQAEEAEDRLAKNKN